MTIKIDTVAPNDPVMGVVITHENFVKLSDEIECNNQGDSRYGYLHFNLYGISGHVGDFIVLNEREDSNSRYGVRKVIPRHEFEDFWQEKID